MKSFVRNALLGAAGLVALSLSANAAGPTSVTDTPLFKSAPTTADAVQVAQRRDLFGTSSGSVGFKKSKKKKKKK